MKRILITGGTGEIGSMLANILTKEGHEVSLLSRSKNNKSKYKIYLWDIAKQEIDHNAILNNDVIVHLAGAGVFDERWTDEYKKIILESRTQSSKLLKDAIIKCNKKPEALIAASAIGFYGAATTEHWHKEDETGTQDFLAEVVKKWEAGNEEIAALGIRTVKIRIGIVMSSKGGALEQMATPIKYGVGAKLGTGKQWVSWIHIEDLCRIFKYAINHEEISGVFNAACPNPVTNEELTASIAKVLERSLIVPFVPAFALQLILGKEKASFVLGGSRVSPDKILATGFQFKYPYIDSALETLLK